MSWIKTGAENVLLKKFGIIAIVIGLVIAVLVVRQYIFLINSAEYTKDTAKYYCNSDNDCTICDGECKSTIGNVCNSMVFSRNCRCINHTCTNVLNE